MKSIKEKAEDYEKSLAKQYYSWLDITDSYAAGANYVLEEVDDILYRRYSDDGDPNQRWIDMKKLIESLKK